MIRRKSDAHLSIKDCGYRRALEHEYANQSLHQVRQQDDPEHDPAAQCWCCCERCTDLTFHYESRKGVWWARTPSGELALMRETSDELHTSPETRPSS